MPAKDNIGTTDFAVTVRYRMFRHVMLNAPDCKDFCDSKRESVTHRCPMVRYGSFLPASYRRLDRPADHRQDRPLLEEAILAFFDAVSKARSAEMLRRVDRVRRQESAPGPEALVP